MVNAQEWLDKNYPLEGVCMREINDKGIDDENCWNNFGKTRSEITKLDISNQNLTGTLDLTDFSNLENLHCHNNQLTTVEFLDNLLNPEKLKVLGIFNNNIQPTDIEIFSKFTNLKYLKIGTTKDGLKAGKHNKFFGSLQAYQNSTKLESICIEATDVDSGLEYLPTSLSTAIQQEKKEGKRYSRIECSPRGTNAKCKAIQDQLRPFNYDLATWRQLVNTKYPDLTKQIGETNWRTKPKYSSNSTRTKPTGSRPH